MLANKNFHRYECTPIQDDDIKESGTSQFASYGRDIRDLDDVFEQLWVTRNIDWFLAIQDGDTGKVLATGRGKAAEDIFEEFQVARLDVETNQNDAVGTAHSWLYLPNCVAQRGNPECAHQVNCDYYLETTVCAEGDDDDSEFSLWRTTAQGSIAFCLSEECRIRGAVIDWWVPLEMDGNDAEVFASQNWTLTQQQKSGSPY
jgi:hypothetical protein